MPNMTQVFDLDGAKMLVLDNEAKTAFYMDTTGSVQEGTKSHVEFLKNIVMKLKDCPDIQTLGKKQIQGLEAVGFFVQNPGEQITIWADSETAVPIWIELKLGQFHAVFKNLEFDVPVDESLVSMDVPDGYTYKESNINLSDATEQDLIETLRIWAQYQLNGSFLDSVNSETFLKEIALIAEKVNCSDLPDE